QIERRGLLGEEHGIVPGERHHGGAEAERPRARADPREQVQRRRDLPEAGEVVLDDERRFVAERFGLDVVLDEVLEPSAAVDVRTAPLRLRAPKYAEPHGSVVLLARPLSRMIRALWAGV